MSTRTRSLSLLVARFAAVGVALAVGGYLVVTAQRRANPEPAPIATPDDHGGGAPESSASDPDTSVGAGMPAAAVVGAPDSSVEFLPSSKSHVIGLPTIDAPQDPTYLLGSKSGMVTTIDTTVTPTDSPVLLPSSKFGGFSTRSSPPPPTFPPIEPVTTTPSSPTPASTDAPPVFLPTSKSLTIRDAVRPAPRPAPTPGSSAAPKAPQPQTQRPQPPKPEDP